MNIFEIYYTAVANSYDTDFDGAKDLPELIIRKIKTNIDSKHADLPSTQKLMDLYNFEVICDKELNFPDNTYAGNVFLNDKLRINRSLQSIFCAKISPLVHSEPKTRLKNIFFIKREISCKFMQKYE